MPFTEADPVAVLGLSLGALGHCAWRARVQGQPLIQLMALVGDGRARSGAAWDHVDRLFSWVSEGWKEGVQLRTLPPCRDWPRLVDGWDGKGIGKGTFLGTSRREEIRDLLTKQQASDLASRTLLLRIRGGTPRPLGERFPLLDNAVNGLRKSIVFAKGLRKLDLTPEAEKLWEAMYSVLREPRDAGTMIDIMTELAERHVLRLAGLYAVVDQSPEIKPEHLLAALAVWDYSEGTLYELFAHQAGDKKQGAVLRNLRDRHPAGMTTFEVNRTVLQGNLSGGAGPLLRQLEGEGLIYSREEPASGHGRRPTHRWFLTQEALDGGVRRSYLGIAQAIMRKTV